MIPLILKIQIVESNREKIKLFIPLIIVWILLLPFLILLVPFVLIAGCILLFKGYGKFIWAFWPRFFALMNSLSGLVVHVESPEDKVFIY